MDNMRIAIIIPYLHKIEGNKTALLLASQLMKEGNDVSLIIWKIKSTIYEDLTEKYPGLKIKYHKILKKGKFGIIFAIKYWFSESHMRCRFKDFFLQFRS